jgi:hypothetical protein
MRPVIRIALVGAIALGVIAAAVFAAGDRQMFVSPPEAVAEDFVRALAGGRYDVAMAYVEPSAGITPGQIQERSDTLRRIAGAVSSVDVAGVWIQGDTAGAVAAIDTRDAGTLTERLALAWTPGGWRITK